MSSAVVTTSAEFRWLIVACNHPSLVNKDYKMDRDAIEPKAASKGNEADDDADDLAAMFGSLGVSNAKRCQVCQTEYVLFRSCFIVRNDMLIYPLEGCLHPLRARTAPIAPFSPTRPAASHWQDLPTFLQILLKSGKSSSSCGKSTSETTWRRQLFSASLLACWT